MVRAGWAHALYYIFCLTQLETVGKLYHRNGLFLDAIGPPTLHTGKVHVVQMSATLAPTHAILAFSRTVVNLVKQFMFVKQYQRAKYARAVERRQPILNIAQ